MRVVTSREMREIDHAAINEYGIPGVVLMENAGLQVVQMVQDKLGDMGGKVITIFAGKGNNGGDGLVAARHLHNRGAEVKVMLLAKPEDITGDAAINLNIWLKMEQNVYPVVCSDDLYALCPLLEKTDLIVDAIYGTGFKGTVREPAGSVMKAINGCGKPVIAVDIPSGVEADTGRVSSVCIKAISTVTFAHPKLGLLLYPGAEYAGRVRVADISIPALLGENKGLKRSLLGLETVSEWLPPRPAVSHKGDFGRVLVVAGSAGLTGAACLTAEAVARTGAGMVTLAVPEGMLGIVGAKLTEVMTYPLPQTEQQSLSLEALPVIARLLEKADVLAMGPGLSTNPETVQLVRKLAGSLSLPCVLDADGLNAMANRTEIFKQAKAPLVLTPHPGEMARLTGLAVSSIEQDRLGTAEKYASLWGAVVALKGVPTLVTSPDGHTYINSSGNPGMSGGGSGDVLTGIIAGLLAQGMDAVRAAAAGVYLHGLAGDKAAEQKGMLGMLAGDILSALPGVLRELEDK